MLEPRCRSACPSRVLSAACALLVACAEQPSIPALTYERTVRDLLLDAREFEVVRPNPAAPHTLGALTPSHSHLDNGAELRALVLPPPTEVRFEVGTFDGPRFLRLQAGIDLSAARFMRRKAAGGQYTFEVLVNGESVSRASVRVPPEPALLGTEWQPLPGADRLRVRAGDVVSLRTGLLDAAGAPFVAPFGPRVGFGGLRLEAVVRRPRAVATPEAPNLIVVVVDTLRRDRLSTYGYERPTSPVLDALARRGTLFEDAYSTSPWTWPSTASLLTGLQVREHGLESYRSSFLALDQTTLGEVCEDAGLATAGWSGNPLIAERHGFAQGFQQLNTAVGGMTATGEFFDEVQAWLADVADQRFMLYLHLVEPHHPLEPLPGGRALLAADVVDPAGRLAREAHLTLHNNSVLGAQGLPLEQLLSAADQRDISDLYDACVWSADAWLGRLLEEVDALGLGGRTLIAFTSDHGEELFERGQLGHGRSIHGELVRIPLVLAGPGVPVGQRVGRLTSNRQLAGYLAGRVGSSALGPSDLLERPGEQRDEAAPVLFSTRIGAWPAEAVADLGVELLGLREGSLITHYALPSTVGLAAGEVPSFDPTRLRIFDLAQDAGERVDLATGDPARARAAWSALNEHFGALQRVRGPDSEPVSAGTLELLQRIGYIGR